MCVCVGWNVEKKTFNVGLHAISSAFSLSEVATSAHSFHGHKRVVTRGGSGAKLLLGRRRVSQGWQKHFSFGQAKCSTMQALCTCVEAAKQLIIHTKQ